MRPLKVGLHIPEIERIVTWQEIAAICRTAETVGFDSIWVPDHLIYEAPGVERKGPWECWSMLAAIAAITSRVEIGPLVLCSSFRNPALAAKMADTLEEISGGRLILGLGAGWHEPEFRAFGYPYDTRFGQFFESFTIIRELLATGHSDFHGKYYQLDDCELRPRGPRSSGPPLMIGSRGEQVLRKTLPHVAYWNGWATWWGNDVHRLGEMVQKIDSICREVGRDPATLQKTASVFIRMEGGFVPDNSEAPCFMGTAAEIAAMLRAHADLGIAHVQVVLDPETVEGVARFGEVLALLDNDEGGTA